MNFRDLGNYSNIEGDAMVRTGRLFRSATPEGTNSSFLAMLSD